VAFLEKEKDNLSNANVFTLTNTQQTETIETTETNSLNWQGTTLEFAELVKALYESNKLNPELKQIEIFKRLKHLFNIDDFNENDKLKDIRRRTNTTPPPIKHFINLTKQMD
jgi:hypothetical protein